MKIYLLLFFCALEGVLGRNVREGTIGVVPVSDRNVTVRTPQNVNIDAEDASVSVAVPESQESTESWVNDGNPSESNESLEMALEEQSSEETEQPPLGWIPTAVLMSNDSILSIDKLWKSVEDLWVQKTKELREGIDSIVPTAVIMRNGNTVPIDGFWKIMDAIWSERSENNIPDYKPVPKMSRNSQGILVYSNGSPVPLPSSSDTALPVMGWKRKDEKNFVVSLMNPTGEIKEATVPDKDFKNLLEGKSVQIEEDGVVGAQFAGGMFGCGGYYCPNYCPCMYNYGGSRNYFQMSAGSSSGWMQGSYW